MSCDAKGVNCIPNASITCVVTVYKRYEHCCGNYWPPNNIKLNDLDKLFYFFEGIVWLSLVDLNRLRDLVTKQPVFRSELPLSKSVQSSDYKSTKCFSKGSLVIHLVVSLVRWEASLDLEVRVRNSPGNYCQVVRENHRQNR